MNPFYYVVMAVAFLTVDSLFFYHMGQQSQLADQAKTVVASEKKATTTATSADAAVAKFDQQIQTLLVPQPPEVPHEKTCALSAADISLLTRN